MQKTRVWSLIWEDPIYYRETKPVRYNYWAHVPELLKPVHPRAHAMRSLQEKPLHWEACAPQLESRPCSLQLEKSVCSDEEPAQPKINTKNYFLKRAQKKKKKKRKKEITLLMSIWYKDISSVEVSGDSSRQPWKTSPRLGLGLKPTGLIPKGSSVKGRVCQVHWDALLDHLFSLLPWFTPNSVVYLLTFVSLLPILGSSTESTLNKYSQIFSFKAKFSLSFLIILFMCN